MVSLVTSLPSSKLFGSQPLALARPLLQLSVYQPRLEPLSCWWWLVSTVFKPVPLHGAAFPPPTFLPAGTSYLAFHSAGCCGRPSPGCSLTAQPKACWGLPLAWCSCWFAIAGLPARLSVLGCGAAVMFKLGALEAACWLGRSL